MDTVTYIYSVNISGLILLHDLIESSERWLAADYKVTLVMLQK